ncbi:hypothetical protein ACFSQE_18495 [Vogesella fluminis]|uniref:hypothetical protein n=1 Tax=Vogesella fluminis TaxID=1069161 RepID=UPI00362C820F
MSHSLTLDRPLRGALRLPTLPLLTLLTLLSGGSLLLACSSGSIALGAGELWLAASGHGSQLADTLLSLRLERALTAWSPAARWRWPAC